MHFCTHFSDSGAVYCTLLYFSYKSYSFVFTITSMQIYHNINQFLILRNTAYSNSVGLFTDDPEAAVIVGDTIVCLDAYGNEIWIQIDEIDGQRLKGKVYSSTNVQVPDGLLAEVERKFVFLVYHHHR